MAKPGGQNRGDETPDHTEQEERPRTGYRARGQGLQALPNSDLMPAPADSARAAKPRVITPEGTGSSGAGSSKILILGGLVVVVLAVGGFLALSGGDEADAGTVVAEAEPTTPAETESEAVAAVTAPAEEPVTAPAADAPVTEETQETEVAAAVVETPKLPAMDNVTVVLYQFASATPWEAAANLRTLGVGAVAMSEAAIPVAQNQVRFYSPTDQDAAMALAERYEATLVDLTWYSPAPATATLDLWLAE